MTDQIPDRLGQIQHIVVVMMENRSFDHMLGYLSLNHPPGGEGSGGLGPIPEIDGLTGPDVNFNVDPSGATIPITAFDADADNIQRAGEALSKALDPDHSPAGVAKQLGTLSDGRYPMDGFVRAFVESRKPEDHVGENLSVVPMGYYTAKDLPTYDFLAHHYLVCDNWHSSIPGDTWPNRLYSLAGTNAESKHEDLWEQIKHLFHGTPIGNAPIFDVAAFTRHLDDSQWRWYSHDPATLRAADGLYRSHDNLKPQNFAYFNRKKVSWLTQEIESEFVGHDSFLDDAAKGQLRSVSWIDPNFIDLKVLDPNSNDDHPPTDIRAGQSFILEVYEALTRSPNWDDTLLVIVYDEHGGFYDHVSPPLIDDGSGYDSLGVRVPAIIVGPRVSRTVCHDTLDHTVLIKTILKRFARDPEGAINAMGARVGAAQDLGIVLGDRPRTDIPGHDNVRAAMDQWRLSATKHRRGGPGDGEKALSPAPDGAGRRLVLQEFQEGFVRFGIVMQRLLGPGQP
jgi:phospholipase C